MREWFLQLFSVVIDRGREWEREVKFCGRINKREIVSKWFLRCWCLVFSRSFVHDCKTAKCFQNQGEQKIGTNGSEIENWAKIRHKSVMLSALQLMLNAQCSKSKNPGDVIRMS